ncbi:hypothetical protein RB195_001728 [Necator americanus]|uniref:Uncharacterized protein n=1 Tax=Necator americanus TaxID=51031 RepID=A0ABR1DFN5_NECAM
MRERADVNDAEVDDHERQHDLELLVVPMLMSHVCKAEPLYTLDYTTEYCTGEVSKRAGSRFTSFFRKNLEID